MRKWAGPDSTRAMTRGNGASVATIPYGVTYLEAVARVFEFAAAQLQPRVMPLEANRNLVDREGLAVVS